MMNKLLYILTAKLPCRIINSNGNPYLERYNLGKLFGVTFYLHRFLNKDGDRNVHDHPWTWARSFILSGGYEEELLYAFDAETGWYSKYVDRRWYNYIGPNTFHKIINVKPKTWTLFIHGKRFKKWGFLSKIPEGVLYNQPYDLSKNVGWKEHSAIGSRSKRMPL